MSWIDDEINADKKRNEEAAAKQERELHRAKLIEAKGRELWDALRNVCRELTQEYERKCGVAPHCKVRFDDSDPDSFFVQMEHVSERPRALARLRLRNYQIEIEHIYWRGGSDPQKTKLHFAFDCDGLDVMLSCAGERIAIPSAAERILKPVLSSI